MNIKAALVFSAFTMSFVRVAAQTYNDGPMELRIRVTEVRVDYHPDQSQSDDFNLSGSITGVISGVINVPNLATDEIACKVWARASQDVTGLGWQGGTAYTADLPMSNGGPESFVISNPTPIFQTTYTGTTVPQFFDLKLQAWEDDKPGDFDQLPASVIGVLTNDCQTADGFRRDAFEGTNSCCIKIFGACVYSEEDDIECNADPFATNLDYRLGPPCQWYSHGFIAGNCPQNNYYQVKVESYYRFTIGLNCASPIDLGNIGPGSVVSHFNSNECYSNSLPGSRPGNDVFYKFHINNPIGIDINLCNSSTLFDTYVYLLDANCNIIDFNDDGAGAGCGNRSLLSKSLCIPGDYYVVVDGKDANSLGTFRLFVAENSAFTFAANITKTDPKCSGSTDGTAKVSVIGGVPSYTYAWSNGFNDTLNTNLAAGTYTVTVTDQSGCQTTATSTLINPAPVNVNVTTTDLTCSGANDGSATANVNGGFPPYTYAWNSSPPQVGSTAVLLPAGTYSVTVADQNSCTATGSGSVTANNPIVITVDNVSNVSCNGLNNGSIALTVTGGVVPYVYSWSHGPSTDDVTGLSPGQYIFTVFDNTTSPQCFETKSFDITQPQVLISVVNTTRNVTCFGGSDGAVDLGVSGGTQPYTYLWSDNSTREDLLGSPAGSVSVTVTDLNGCTHTTTVSLTQPTAISSTVTVSSDAGCSGSTGGSLDLEVSGGVTPYSYIWSNNGETTQDVSGLLSGNYQVVITDASGCVNVNNATIGGYPELVVQRNVTNPACIGKDNGSITLTVSGAAPFTYLWSDGSTGSSLDNLAAGSYSVTVTDANGCSVVVPADVATPATNCEGNIMDVAIPNVFSPNGDGINEFFDIFAADDVSRVSVKIYDRYGAKIYENPNQTPNIEGAGWDGKIRGKDAQLGAYTYVMEIEYSTPNTTDRPTQKTGTITVVR